MKTSLSLKGKKKKKKAEKDCPSQSCSHFLSTFSSLDRSFSLSSLRLLQKNSSPAMSAEQVRLFFFLFLSRFRASVSSASRAPLPRQRHRRRGGKLQSACATRRKDAPKEETIASSSSPPVSPSASCSLNCSRAASVSTRRPASLLFQSRESPSGPVLPSSEGVGFDRMGWAGGGGRGGRDRNFFGADKTATTGKSRGASGVSPLAFLDRLVPPPSSSSRADGREVGVGQRLRWRSLLGLEGSRLCESSKSSSSSFACFFSSEKRERRTGKNSPAALAASSLFSTFWPPLSLSSLSPPHFPN